MDHFILTERQGDHFFEAAIRGDAFGGGWHLYIALWTANEPDAKWKRVEFGNEYEDTCGATYSRAVIFAYRELDKWRANRG